MLWASLSFSCLKFLFFHCLFYCTIHVFVMKHMIIFLPALIELPKKHHTSAVHALAMESLVRAISLASDNKNMCLTLHGTTWSLMLQLSVILAQRPSAAEKSVRITLLSSFTSRVPNFLMRFDQEPCALLS